MVGELADAKCQERSREKNGNVHDDILPTCLWYLCAIWADPVQSSGGAVQEADDLQEVVIADTPGAVNQEDQVSFGGLTDWMEREEKLW